METGGNCDAKGASGESGCTQMMPSSWVLFAKEVYGEVREMTPTRERYVAYKMVEKWLSQGLSAQAIFLRWNAGGAKECGSGVNKHGVSYDSCSYVKKALAVLYR